MKEVRLSKRAERSLLKEYRRRYQLILLLPGVAALIMFCYVPMYGVLIAFKDYKFLQGITGSAWIGIEHFRTLFGQQNFAGVIYNTVYISIFKLLLWFPDADYS